MYNSRCNCSSNSGRGSSCARNGERILVNQSGCNTESRSRCSCVNTYRPGCGGIMAAAAVITMTMTAVVEAMETLMAVAAAITVRVRQVHVHQDHARQNRVRQNHVHRDHARQDRVRHALAVRTAAVSSIAAA